MTVGAGVLTGGDATEEVSIGLSEESATEGVGVGVLTATDAMLSDGREAEGVGVTPVLLGGT
jgi:hypothetical protein